MVRHPGRRHPPGALVNAQHCSRRRHHPQLQRRTPGRVPACARATQTGTRTPHAGSPGPRRAARFPVPHDRIQVHGPRIYDGGARRRRPPFGSHGAGGFAEAGTSPAAEIRRLRLEHARALLERGHAVQTACFASGFLDPGTFTRGFRQRFGLVPSQVPPSPGAGY
ncbi:helix-turn-helix domain-containing protein [Arthrobacter sp. ATA002]|uniref:helix-turn-helix domain-containing protein n=1 Tax=Arthrobacter sp. ATA002 TaxID=2991715 RepID=UPI003FA45BD9